MEKTVIEQRNGVCQVTYSGELTLEVTSQLKERIEQALENEHCQALVMDLSETVFLDSSGIGFLVSLNKKMRQQDNTFYLYRPSSQVRKTLSLVKLLDYFHIAESEEELPEGITV
ncbi:STAS domain-containing protein [Desulfohalobium retbaense]|uniref:Anti-sigma factor antagonist n=1 Tax=Desulfohalobium retbaense (strain ATCC 49708 / DSM 5692 / JCM 16813 / HR100) TaxID=485915 RepID=C8X2N2_DESRD|nr:STAS domain-containing protein [Desulfohalobium retbaense]ACV68679.1 anti-sigma-factor antagonist [Desulfohalobium retbaense DSM 5692]